MSHTIQAIFDAGIFRPLEPVELAEGTPVVVQVTSPIVNEEMDEKQRLALIAYLDQVAALPDHSPPDGLSNRDHDRIIYGA